MNQPVLSLILAAIVQLASVAWCADKPNIIILFADDMGYSDIGCYGGEIKTPNLDRLAAAGLRYSQMYNTSRGTTSRSCLLTGRYVLGSTYLGNYEVGPTLGEVLKTAGYRTLWSGKNHSNILPPERGFDRFYGFQGGACNYWNPGDKLRDGGNFPHITHYKWMVIRKESRRPKQQRFSGKRISILDISASTSLRKELNQPQRGVITQPRASRWVISPLPSPERAT